MVRTSPRQTLNPNSIAILRFVWYRRPRMVCTQALSKSFNPGPSNVTILVFFRVKRPRMVRTGVEGQTRARCLLYGLRIGSPLVSRVLKASVRHSMHMLVGFA